MTQYEQGDNAEHMLIDAGSYHTLRTSAVRENGEQLCIVPKSLPVLPLILNNLLVAVIFAGFLWAGIEYGEMRPYGSLMVAVVLLGVLTCGLLTLFFIYAYRKENQSGPWLVIEKATGRVTLPRDGLAFDREQIVHLQYVTGYTTEEYVRGEIVTTQQSELNLLTCIDGHRKRWPIMRTLGTGGLGKIAKRILKSTDVPLVRCKQHMLHRGVEVTDMRTGTGFQPDSA